MNARRLGMGASREVGWREYAVSFYLVPLMRRFLVLALVVCKSGVVLYAALSAAAPYMTWGLSPEPRT